MSSKKPTPSVEIVGNRTPVADVDLEKHVLGGLLVDQGAWAIVESFLKPSTFYLSAHQDIFGMMVLLKKDRAPIDLKTLSSISRQKGVLERIGGAYYLSKLSDGVYSTANMEYNARVLEQMAIKRRLTSLCMSVLSQSYEDTSDPFDLIEQLTKGINDPDIITQGSVISVSDRIDKTMELIEAAVAGTVTGYSVGIDEVDNLTGGIHKGEMTIIAGRPGMGKTAFALHISRSLALQGIPVYWAQLEMSDVQVGLREIAAATAIPTSELRQGKLSEDQIALIKNKLQELRNLPLYIDTDAYLNVNTLRMKAASAINRYGAKVFMLDYLQLVDAQMKAGMNYTQAVGTISRQCKLISKEYNIPVVALSQLSREVEKRPLKRPQLSDLRDSGTIEQDADSVWFLYRPEYYGIDTISVQGFDVPSKGLTEVIVAKQRQGATGSTFVETRIDLNRYGKQYYSDQELDFQ